MEIKQIIPASHWFVSLTREYMSYKEVIDPIACWALVHDETDQSDKVIGMIDHDGLILVEHAEDKKIKFHYYISWDELDEEQRASIGKTPINFEQTGDSPK